MFGLLRLLQGRASDGLRADAPFALALALALALTAGACASSPDRGQGAGDRAARAGSPPQSGAQGETGKKLPWWRLSQYSRKPFLTPREKQERRPGLFSGKDGEFVLFRVGEVDSPDSTKPSKVRR